MDWLDTYSDPSVKAASVVTNLWIACFAITSVLFALLGTCALSLASVSVSRSRSRRGPTIPNKLTIVLHPWTAAAGHQH